MFNRKLKVKVKDLARECSYLKRDYNDLEKNCRENAHYLDKLKTQINCDHSIHRREIVWIGGFSHLEFCGKCEVLISEIEGIDAMKKREREINKEKAEYYRKLGEEA